MRIPNAHSARIPRCKHCAYNLLLEYVLATIYYPWPPIVGSQATKAQKNTTVGDSTWLYCNLGMNICCMWREWRQKAFLWSEKSDCEEVHNQYNKRIFGQVIHEICMRFRVHHVCAYWNSANQSSYYITIYIEVHIYILVVDRVHVYLFVCHVLCVGIGIAKNLERSGHTGIACDQD